MTDPVADRRSELTYEFPAMEPDRRLRELILYVAHKCLDDPHFGATKLNKILFWTDFQAFARWKHPVTGCAYQKLPQGPAPKRMLPVREEMKRLGDIYEIERPFFDKVQKRLVPSRAPDLSIFSAEEIALVEEVLDQVAGLTATELSALSHGIAWQATPDRQLIPYEFVYLVEPAPLTDWEVQKSRELMAELGLDQA